MKSFESEMNYTGSRTKKKVNCQVVAHPFQPLGHYADFWGMFVLGLCIPGIEENKPAA